MPFFAKTTRFRRRVVPRSNEWVRLVVFRRGTGVLRLAGRSASWPVRPGSVALVMPRVQPTVEPDGLVTATRLFLSVDYALEQVRLQHPDLGVDALSVRLALEGAISQQAHLIQLSETGLGTVGPFLDRLAEVTADAKIGANPCWAAQWTMGVLGVVLPQLDVSLRLVSVAGSPQGGFVHDLSPPVLVALAWIGAHCRGSWQLGDVAGAAGLSVSGLTKAFARQVGQSPMEVRDRLRVKQMGRLLLKSTMTVGDAAVLVGWSSSDQATQTFRRVAGVTPSQWREGLRGNGAGGGEAVDLVLEAVDLAQYRG